MDPRFLAVVGVTALLVAACGASSGQADPTPTPTLVAADGGGGASGSGRLASDAPPASAPASDPADPPPGPSDDGAGVVNLRGHLVGHSEDPLARADQTIDFELRWNAGPDDIHDLRAFVFTEGSYTFSESIDGVCGGSFASDGPLQVDSDTGMDAALGPQDQLAVSLVDFRLETGNVAITSFSGVYVSEPDPAGCAELSRFGVHSCTMEFPWLGIGRLAEEASCADASRGVTWSGTLVPIP